MNNITTEDKRIILKAIKGGFISEADVISPDFDFSLYTYKTLPLYVAYNDSTKLYEFFNRWLTESQFHKISKYYESIGINQQIIIIEQYV